ncbi:putative RNA-directed DNA polymerase [Tanacetum coccineum]
MNINQEELESPFGPTYEEEQEVIDKEQEIVTQSENLGPHDESPSDEFFDPPTEQTVVNELCDTQHSSHAQVDESENTHNEHAEPVQTKRTRTQPRHLKDFVVQLPPSVDPTKSRLLDAFLAAIDSNNEPKYFHQAVKDERWKEAMKKEIRALKENDTWTLEELLKHKQAIDSKWVYKVKYKPNGEVERTLLVVAVKKEWTIHQLDVNNAFLHGDLNEEVYMKIPQGFAKEGETRVCRLRKSIYDLKQASRNWGNDFMAALIYVDDVIMVGNNTIKIQNIKDKLDKLFNIKDLGNLKYFFGIEVSRTSEGLVLSHRKYTLDILKYCGLQGCKPSLFPIEQNHKLDKCENEPKVGANRYRRIIGRLLYLQAIRPDLAYSVNVLSQFVSDPRQPHMDATNRVLRYLKATIGQGILFPRNGGCNLMAYYNSDWLGCSRKSRTGYLLLLSLGGQILDTWDTALQGSEHNHRLVGARAIAGATNLTAANQTQITGSRISSSNDENITRRHVCKKKERKKEDLRQSQEDQHIVRVLEVVGGLLELYGWGDLVKRSSKFWLLNCGFSLVHSLLVGRCCCEECGEGYEGLARGGGEGGALRRDGGVFCVFGLMWFVLGDGEGAERAGEAGGDFRCKNRSDRWAERGGGQCAGGGGERGRERVRVRRRREDARGDVGGRRTGDVYNWHCGAGPAA